MFHEYLTRALLSTVCTQPSWHEVFSPPRGNLSQESLIIFAFNITSNFQNFSGFLIFPLRCASRARGLILRNYRESRESVPKREGHYGPIITSLLMLNFFCLKRSA